MQLSFYDNQEATSRGYFILGVLSLALGFAFLGLVFFYFAIAVSDEDRLTEEELLDSSEPTLHYSLSVQREKIAKYLRRKGLLYRTSREESRNFYDYLGDEYLYEKKMLAEIYEFPLSTILSNNYYLIPEDEEHHFLRFLYFSRKLPPLPRRRKNLSSNLMRGPRYALSLRDLPRESQEDEDEDEEALEIDESGRPGLSPFLAPHAYPPTKAKIRIEHRTITNSDG